MILPNKVTRRVGNWCEESVLREEKLREFLEKIESGEVGFKRHDRRMELVHTPTTLSPVLLFDENIMIMSVRTHAFVAPDIPDHFPNLKDTDTLPAMTTRNISLSEPKARTTVQLERMIDLGPGFDKRPRWGEKLYIRIHLPGVSQKFYLASDIRTTSNFQGCKRQRTYMTTVKDYNAIWYFEWADKSYRLEMEGTPIQPFIHGLITHSQTGNRLGSDHQFVARSNDFGVEYSLDCHSNHDYSTRLESEHNHFVMCVARK